MAMQGRGPRPLLGAGPQSEDGAQASQGALPDSREEVLRLADGERYGSPKSPPSQVTKNLRRISAQPGTIWDGPPATRGSGRSSAQEGLGPQGDRRTRRVGDPAPSALAQDSHCGPLWLIQTNANTIWHSGP